MIARFMFFYKPGVTRFLFVVRGVREEVTFEEPGQGGGSTFCTCVSLLHSLDLGVIIAVGNDVARG